MDLEGCGRFMRETGERLSIFIYYHKCLKQIRRLVIHFSAWAITVYFLFLLWVIHFPDKPLTEKNAISFIVVFLMMTHILFKYYMLYGQGRRRQSQTGYDFIYYGLITVFSAAISVAVCLSHFTVVLLNQIAYIHLGVVLAGVLLSALRNPIVRLVRS
jgi:hypothetical protein